MLQAKLPHDEQQGDAVVAAHPLSRPPAARVANSLQVDRCINAGWQLWHASASGPTSGELFLALGGCQGLS